MALDEESKLLNAAAYRIQLPQLAGTFARGSRYSQIVPYGQISGRERIYGVPHVGREGEVERSIELLGRAARTFWYRSHGASSVQLAEIIAPLNPDDRLNTQVAITGQHRWEVVLQFIRSSETVLKFVGDPTTVEGQPYQPRPGALVNVSGEEDYRVFGLEMADPNEVMALGPFFDRATPISSQVYRAQLEIPPL